VITSLKPEYTSSHIKLPNKSTIENETKKETINNEIMHRNPAIISNKNNSGTAVIISENKKYNTSEFNKVYKWRDKNNIINISMYPPKHNYATEVLLFSRIENKNSDIKQMLSNIDMPKNNIHIQSGFIDNPLQVYTPSGLREFIQYRKSIGDTIKLREKELNDLIEQL